MLGLCLRRLSEDWQTRWGHPVLVVESFVEETRSRGPCDRACGFAAVGLTEDELDGLLGGNAERVLGI